MKEFLVVLGNIFSSIILIIPSSIIFIGLILLGLIFIMDSHNWQRLELKLQGYTMEQKEVPLIRFEVEDIGEGRATAKID